MRIVRFHLEPWQKGGSEISSPSSASPSFALLSPSVQRRQRAPSLDDLSNLDANLFEKKSPRHLYKRKYPQMVKKLVVLCSDVIARNVRIQMCRFRQWHVFKNTQTVADVTIFESSVAHPHLIANNLFLC